MTISSPEGQTVPYVLSPARQDPSIVDHDNAFPDREPEPEQDDLEHEEVP